MIINKNKIIKSHQGSQVDWGHPINNGLVGMWLFNEGIGNTAYDIAKVSPGPAHGNLVGNPIWSPGMSGRSLGFAANKYVTTPKFNLAFSRCTILAWLYKTSTVVNAGIVMCRGSADICGMIISNSDSNALGFVWSGTGFVVAGPIIPFRQWFLAAITVTPTLVTLMGASTAGVSFVNSAGSFASNRFDDLRFGGDELDHNSRFFGGRIDNVRILNRAITRNEFLALYQQPFLGIRSKRNIYLKAPTGIQFDAASNSGYQAAASTYNWSHTTSGSDRYLVVGISMLSLAQTVSGITYNSIPLTFLGAQSSVSGAARVEMWGLANPTIGSNSIAVTLTGAIASAGNASSYTGVHQTSSTEAFNSAQATNVGAADATVNVTTIADKDFTVDILATDDTAVTVGSGQTQTGNVSGAGGSGAMSYEGPDAIGITTMSWTNVAALATWAIGSVALRPIAASNVTATASPVKVPITILVNTVTAKVSKSSTASLTKASITIKANSATASTQSGGTISASFRAGHRKVPYLKQNGMRLNYGHPLSRGVQGVWLLNEYAGKRVYDASGLNKPGVITGCTQDNGRFGRALNFNGTSDLVLLNNIGVANNTAFTISVWFKTTSTGRIYCEGNTVTGAPLVSFSTGLDAANVLSFVMRDDDFTGNSFILSNKSVNDGRWHHAVAVQFSKSRRIMILDGIQQGVVDTTTLATFTINNSVLGVFRTTSDIQFLTGQVDLVRTYNRALSLQEVSQLYVDPFAGLELQKPIIIGIQGTAQSGGTSATATPNSAKITVLVNSVTAKVSKSATASPSLASVTVRVNSATGSTSASRSSTATPSVATVRILVNTVTAASGSGRTVSPSTAVVKVSVNSATASFKRNATVAVSLALTRILVNTATASTSRSATASPTTKTVTIIVNTATVTVKASKTVTPSATVIRLVVNSATATTQIGGGSVVVTLYLKSPIETNILNNSRIEQYLTKKSAFEKNLVLESEL